MSAKDTPEPAIETLSATKLALTVRRLRARAGGAALLDAEPIAIVGIGCRFPGGANDPASYWARLSEGFDAITEVPADRWDVDAFFDPNPDAPGKMSTRFGGFIEDVLGFDAAFFGVSAREAASIDPQHRLFLEVAWQALEDAGCLAEAVRGARAGVYVGITTDDYAQLQLEARAGADIYTGTGVTKSAAAGRLSYLLGLNGPSMAVDTACSSSLVATHLACSSLRAEQADIAIAGGVNVLLSPNGTIQLSRLRAMAADGRCKTFDAAADGFVRAEGCGVVVLKRLADALADGDRIHALIRGSAVNHGGGSSGLTVPSGPAQEAVINAALASAGVAAAQIGYVEAHGSGTSLGDPIEVDAIGNTLGAAEGRTTPVILGSVKTNLGHLEAAAGVAGLIKAALVLAHQEIPPHLHLRAVNPHIDLARNRACIATEARPWPDELPRCFAGVSAFGLTGTNAHVVLEAAPPAPQPEPGAEGPFILPLSARSESALRDLAAAVRGQLEDPQVDLPSLAKSASVRRSHHLHRLAVVGTSKSQITEQLDALATAAPDPSAASRGGAAPKVVFVFPGQGSQWLGMARQLLDEAPAFAEAIASCEAAFAAHVDWSLTGALGGDGDALSAIDVIQPALFAIQVALVAQWRTYGVEPDAVIGHSMGEVAAAHVAGALTLADAATIICRRSRLLRRVSGKGEMAVVELSVPEARRAIAGLDDRLSIAVSNAPRTTVISGDPDAIDQVVSGLQAKAVFCRRVKVDVASHSPQMDPLRPDLLEALTDLAPIPARTQMWSTVTGAPVRGAELDAVYWADNLRQPVRFADAVAAAAGDRGGCIFVEISPHPILTPSITQVTAALPSPCTVTGTLRRDEDERGAFLTALGALYAAGYPVAWTRIYDGRVAVVPLPTYPWQHERHRFSSDVDGSPKPAVAGHPLIGLGLDAASPGGRRYYEAPLDTTRLPYLADHQVDGAVLLPASAYLEAGLAAAGGAPLHDVRFEEALVLTPDRPRRLQLVLTDDTPRRFEVFSRETDGPWIRHASGTASPAETHTAPPANLEVIAARCSQALDAEAHYDALAARGLTYGPRFRVVHGLLRRDGEALATLRCEDGLRAEAAACYVVHPAILDGCLQAISAAAPSAGETRTTFVPVALGRLRVHAPLVGPELLVHAVARQTADGYHADLTVTDPTGTVLLEAAGVETRAIDGASSTGGDHYEVRWQAAAAPQASAPPSRCLILTDRAGVTKGLRTSWIDGGAQVAVAAVAEDYRAVEPGAFELNPSDASHFERLLRESFEGHAPQVVLHAWSLDAPPDLDAAALERAEVRGCHALMHLVQALAKAGHRDAPRLYVLTAGAQPARSTVRNVGQAAVWGLARAIAHEHPELGITCIDLEPGTIAPEALVAELDAGDDEDQVAFRAGERLVPRLVHAESVAAPVTAAAADRAFRLEATRPGVLDDLAFVEVDRQPPGPGQVEIEVAAAGLNFLDVLQAMGVYPGQTPGAATLGGECSGTVVATGAAVTRVQVGDRVLAAQPPAFARFVTAADTSVARIPDNLAFEDAAALPLAFMTAQHGLRDLARLREGERVLIHAATGGVGLAAIQIARRAGAQVFVTAGSHEKRAYLSSLGVEHVADSRSATFADTFMAATGGEGLDVVLNTLSGDGINKGLALLRRHGRFVDLSKKDIYDGRALDLSPFARGLAYFAVDLAGMAIDRPDMFGRLLDDVMARFAEGALAPLPRTVFAMHAAADAFAHMASARHVGKIVLDASNASQVAVQGGLPRLRADASYLITGGLGGLGLSLAQWMVDRGARHLVLVGRSAPSPAASTALEVMRTADATVTPLAADIRIREDVERVLRLIDAEHLPLAGVVHAAVVLDDSTLLRLDARRFHAVMAPKVLGAAHLHTLTAERALDFFVLFSSAASMLGSPGQSNYAAANAFLDALAHHRRGLGLPASSINWGPWAEVGLAAADSRRGDRLAYQGIEGFSPAEGLAAFGQVLNRAPAQVAVMRLDPRRWAQSFPKAAASPFLSELSWGDARRQTSALVEALREAEPSARTERLTAHLREQVAGVLRMSPSRVASQAPFGAMGFDSLTGLELRNRLEASLGVRLGATLIWAYPNLEALRDHLLKTLGLGAVEPEQATAADAAVDALEAMSEDDAELLLLAKLAGLDVGGDGD